MAEPFRTPQGAIWVQPYGPNTDVHWVPCHDLDPLSAPGKTIKDIIRCFKPDHNGWDVLAATENPPEQITGSLTGLIHATADWLEQIIEEGNCPFPFYVNLRHCPPNDSFTGADRTFALRSARVTNEGLTNLAMREEDNISTQQFDFSAWPPVMRFRKLTTGTTAVVEGEGEQATYEECDLNDIAFCNVPRCAGDCGSACPPCTEGVIVADSCGGINGGDPANVWYTLDAGATWHLAAATPFLGEEHIMSVTCFQVEADVTRWVVVRGPVAADPAEIAYSDDLGANWTTVALDTIDNVGAMYGGALFSFDSQHIWLALGGDAAYVFFSDDGGATWDKQFIDALGVYADPLWAIWFSDYETGMAVGEGDTVLVTTDGGINWNTGTGTGTARTLKSVTENGGGGIWWVGDAGGEIHFSNDHGTIWAEREFTSNVTGSYSGVGDIGDIRMHDTLCGFMAHNRAAAAGGVIYRTKNGGRHWEAVPVAANRGINALWDCTLNSAYGAGAEGANGYALVLRASG
jgi:photosystem II stability/assembly factor-like uncharacterized protein